MAGHTANIESMPVVRNLADFDQKSGNALERVIFNHRLVVIVVCAWSRSRCWRSSRRASALNASYEKMLPQGHPYISNYLANKNQLRGLGNTLRVVVENTQGDIFDPDLPRYAEEDQRRAFPDARRRPRLGQVAVDAGGALDRGDRGRLPRADR